jgi:hypothetical protein
MLCQSLREVVDWQEDVIMISERENYFQTMPINGLNCRCTVEHTKAYCFDSCVLRKRVSDRR